MSLRFETVDDILAHLIRFHRNLAEYYQHRAEADRNERLRMLATYLTEREQRLAVGLERYRADCDTSHRQTWFDKVPDLEELPALKTAMGASDVDELLNAALGLDRHLLDIYEVMQREATHGELHELFENLLAQQEQEERLLSTSAARMRDI